MGLVVNFKTMQQLTILVTFFQINYRHRASLFFFIIATSIVSIIIIINWQLAFKLDYQVLALDRVATCQF